MAKQISDFTIGTKFKIIGKKFGNIYKGKTFEVYKVYDNQNEPKGNYLMAHAKDHKGKSDGTQHGFTQTNFDAYDDAVQIFEE